MLSAVSCVESFFSHRRHLPFTHEFVAAAPRVDTVAAGVVTCACPLRGRYWLPLWREGRTARRSARVGNRTVATAGYQVAGVAGPCWRKARVAGVHAANALQQFLTPGSLSADTPSRQR